MRTYLVTGGAGFIGSNYIHYMFKKYGDEIRIINVDKLTYAGNLENLKDIEDRDNYTFIKADICDTEIINQIFEENDIDRVVHFAAESHVDRSIKNPEVFVKTNVLGTGEYFYETTPYDPHSPYSASKASSDMLVKAYMLRACYADQYDGDPAFVRSFSRVLFALSHAEKCHILS